MAPEMGHDDAVMRGQRVDLRPPHLGIPEEAGAQHDHLARAGVERGHAGSHDVTETDLSPVFKAANSLARRPSSPRATGRRRIMDDRCYSQMSRGRRRATIVMIAARKQAEPGSLRVPSPLAGAGRSQVGRGAIFSTMIPAKAGMTEG